MYGTNIIGSGLSLGKVLSGISRGLTLANQIIPIYQQAKPMINNARKVLAVMKELNTQTSSKNTIEAEAQIKNTPPTKKVISSTSTPNTSNPVFFQ